MGSIFLCVSSRRIVEVSKKMNSHVMISLFHILVTGPLFIYLGYKAQTQSYAKIPLLVGIIFVGFAFLYLLWKLYSGYDGLMEMIRSGWIYLFHVLLVFPILLYIMVGWYMRPSIPLHSFEIFCLVIFGLLAVMFHVYKMFVRYVM
jgi:hypothetical protein